MSTITTSPVSDQESSTKVPELDQNKVTLILVGGSIIVFLEILNFILGMNALVTFVKSDFLYQHGLYMASLFAVISILPLYRYRYAPLSEKFEIGFCALLFSAACAVMKHYFEPMLLQNDVHLEEFTAMNTRLMITNFTMA